MKLIATIFELEKICRKNLKFDLRNVFALFGKPLVIYKFFCDNKKKQLGNMVGFCCLDH